MNLQQCFAHEQELISLLDKHQVERHGLYQENMQDFQRYERKFFEKGLENFQTVLDCLHLEQVFVRKNYQQGSGYAFRKQCVHCGLTNSQAIAKTALPQNQVVEMWNEQSDQQRQKLQSYAVQIPLILDAWLNVSVLRSKPGTSCITQATSLVAEQSKDRTTVKQQLIDALSQAKQEFSAMSLQALVNSICGDLFEQSKQADILTHIFDDCAASEKAGRLAAWFKAQFSDVFHLREQVAVYKQPIVENGQQRAAIAFGVVDFIADFRDEIKDQIRQQTQRRQACHVENLSDLDLGPFAIKVKYINPDKAEGFSKEYAKTLADCMQYAQSYCVLQYKVDSQKTRQPSNHAIPYVMLLSNLSFAAEQ